MAFEQWRRQFAGNLREAMDIANMRSTDLAFHSRLSESNISKYLAGTQMPTARALVNMSETLGIRVDDLVSFGEHVD